MRFSASAIIALATILSAAEARPHNRPEASGLAGHSGSTNPFVDWLSSLLGALPTGGAGSGFPGLPGFGGGLPTGGAGGFGSFFSATLAFPPGIAPTGPAAAPTGGSGGLGFGLPGYSNAPASTPTPILDLPGFADAPTRSSIAGNFPLDNAAPTGGVKAPATTAPAKLPASGEDPLSTVSFVFASSTVDSGYGGFLGFPGFGKKV